jgi:hypothetical protein
MERARLMAWTPTYEIPSSSSLDPADQGPTKPGWHLVTFKNGAVAVLRWSGQAWVWGSLTAPNSPITGFTYLGSTISAIGNNPKWWDAALAKVPAQIAIDLTSQLDHGILMQGEPVLFTVNKPTASGKPTPDAGAGPGITAQGNSGQTGSEAIPAPIIPTPSVPAISDVGNVLAAIWSAITNPSMWLRVGEALGGVVLIFMALKSLTGVSTPSVATVAKAAARA